MHAEDLLINDTGNWQAVKAVCECLPQLDTVASLALVVKSIYSVNGGALMVATKDEEIVRVFDFVC